MPRYVEVHDNTSLFARPQDDSGEVASLQSGAVVRVIDEANDQFYKVSYQGASGYLLRDVAVQSTIEAFVRQLGSSPPLATAAEPDVIGEESSVEVASQPDTPSEDAVIDVSDVAAPVQVPEEIQAVTQKGDAPTPPTDKETPIDARLERPVPASRNLVSEVRRRFPALQTISGVLRVAGWLILVIGITASIIGAVSAGSIEDGSAATAALALGSGLFSSVIVGVVLLAYADLILLMVDIERNTRATAVRVEELDIR